MSRTISHPMFEVHVADVSLGVSAVQAHQAIVPVEVPPWRQTLIFTLDCDDLERSCPMDNTVSVESCWTSSLTGAFRVRLQQMVEDNA